MDVTSNTASANNMLSGIIGTKNDGTQATGNIATKTSANLTASGSTVTAAAGYYATSASKSVAAGSAFPPAVTITKNPTFSFVSSTGKVTASYAGSSSITPTVSAGYVTAGTAGTISTSGTSTYTLTTQAAQTLYPSTADQTVASYRWLTGAQTFKSVTTSNLTAENIADGVVVKVGDSSNASRITQVTGTHKGSSGPQHTLTITGTTGDNAGYVMYNGQTYTSASSMTFTTGDIVGLRMSATIYTINDVYINGINTFSGVSTRYENDYVLPDYDVVIDLSYISNIKTRRLVLTTPQINITTPGIYDITTYGMASVATGGGINADDIAMRTIYGLISGEATQILHYAFTSCSLITGASFSQASLISNYAFCGCSSLTTISFPAVTRIGNNAFQNCRSLTEISFPNVTSISNYAFENCSNVTTINIPKVVSIGSGAFEYCSKVISISCSQATSIGSTAFMGCSSLTTISFPLVTHIYNTAFSYCTNLLRVDFPSATSVYSSAFYCCTRLSIASFSVAKYFGNSCFTFCSSLESLYILNTTVAALGGSAAFQGTPMSVSTYLGYFGSIYVLASLVNSYKTATNWSLYSDRITSYVE